MRRSGFPRTEEERESRHQERFPGDPLPERGTGQGRISEDGEGVTIPTPLFTFLIGLSLGVFVGPALMKGTVRGRKYLEEKV